VDWDLSYEYLTGAWMGNIIDEVNNDVDWIRENACEHGDEMAQELFNIEEEDAFDDDMALNMAELSKVLEGMMVGDMYVDMEGNASAPTDLENSVEPCTNTNSDLLESNNHPAEVIDVDAIELDSDSDSIISAE
jgi:hypothetical protein